VLPADIETMPKTARKASARDRASEEDSDATTQLDGAALTRRRIIWIVAAALYVVLFVSLASFRSSDWPTHVVASPTDPPLNLCGRFGAAIAYWLYFTFGFGAWIPVLYLGCVLAFSAAGRSIEHPFVRFVGCLVAMCAVGGLHAEWFPSIGPLTGVDAGLIPMWFADELHMRFGPVGASLIFLAGIAVGAIVAADALVFMLPGALARTFSFLSPLWETDWRAHFGALRERMGAVFPQPAVAGAGSGRARRSPSRPAVPVAAPAAVDEEDAEESDADETEDAIADEAEDLDDGEVDSEADDAADVEVEAPVATSAPAPAATEAKPTRAALSEDELRAKIEKLPIKMTAKPSATKLRDEDIPRAVDYSGYQFPTLDLLEEPEGNYSSKMEAYVRDQAGVLTRTLSEYGLEGEITHIESGPVVTLYSVELAAGTRVARLETISKDIARALQAPNVRIIPNLVGRTAVGIEVPNKQKEKVRLKELMSSGHAANMMLPMFLGKDSAGEPLVLDLAKMPHMLIAGTTGSGKSVCMNTIIMSWLYTKRPDELKLVLVDPKMVEMAQFSEIPHLACPVVTEMSKAAAILEWAVTKMEERYELLKEAGVRDIRGFNELDEAELRERLNPADDVEWAKIPKKMHYMVFVIDELADLMMTNKEVEQSIVRIAQKARAVGIHLILATQRPQATVVTGLIKSNMPCRVSFKVASGTDSRIVLDQKGAELLLGQGDMLVVTPSQTDARRSQGTLVEDKEARAVTKFLKTVAAPSFERQLLTIRSGQVAGGGDGGAGDAGDAGGERDPLFDSAVEIMIESGRGSVSLLQRRLAIGYGRASRLVDQMGNAGILGEHKGSVAREVVVTMEEWARMKEMRDEAEASGTVFQTHYDNSDADSEALRFHDEETADEK
jgi:S-DNA-T family DNA segregation ATPase FtsK/SpoIIIE